MEHGDYQNVNIPGAHRVCGLPRHKYSWLTETFTRHLYVSEKDILCFTIYQCVCVGRGAGHERVCLAHV